MLKVILSKVMWVGKATTFLVGLAVMLALVFGVATMALAGTGVGARFDLGKTNTVNAISRLVGSVAGPNLLIDNNSTNSSATALDLQVESGKPPLKVDSETKVDKLNADKLDNKDSSQLLGATVVVRRTDVAVPDGQTVSEFAGCATGESIIGGSANLDHVTSDSLVNISRPSKDNVGIGSVPADGEAFSFWKGTATNAAGGDANTRTMRVFAFCTR